ncbi:MAG: hypothetical protein Q9M39_09590 [Sulfurovum sp.]|nr:hypothetical protein [Sulfurovum sp.]
MENQLYEVSLRSNVIENILNYTNKHKDIKGIDLDSALQASPVVGKALVQMQEDRILLSNLLTDYTYDHPKVLKGERVWV